MSAAPDGIAVLIRAVDELEKENPPAKRTLTLKPTRSDAFCSLHVRLSPTTEELRRLCIRPEEGTVVLEFTREALPKVRSALTDWQDGNEDFCLHPQGAKGELGTKDRASGELWFWRSMLP
jgi:hypothetical protein